MGDLVDLIGALTEPPAGSVPTPPRPAPPPRTAVLSRTCRRFVGPSAQQLQELQGALKLAEQRVAIAEQRAAAADTGQRETSETLDLERISWRQKLDKAQEQQRFGGKPVRWPTLLSLVV